MTVFDPTVAARLQQVFEDDLRMSRELTYDEWKWRGPYQRILEWLPFPFKSRL